MEAIAREKGLKIVKINEWKFNNLGGTEDRVNYLK